MTKDAMQTAARATIFAKVEKGILLHSNRAEASSPENEQAEISIATSPPLQVASPVMSPVFSNTNGVTMIPTSYSEVPPTSLNQQLTAPFPAHYKFPLNTTPGQHQQNLFHHLYSNFPAMLNQQYFLQQQRMTTPFQSPGRLTLPTITSTTNSPTLTSPESAEPRRSAVKRGRPQQAMKPESDDDPTVQKKRHRRLYARNYRAQLREKLDIADELKKQIEILKSSHENELLSLKNDHRDRMDKMKEWYLAELSKRDEMFGMLLRRTGTMTKSP